MLCAGSHAGAASPWTLAGSIVRMTGLGGGTDATRVGCGAGGAGGEVRSNAEAASVLVSVKEEKDLEELLDMFAMGVGDTHTFQECLLDEFHALEVRGRGRAARPGP